MSRILNKLLKRLNNHVSGTLRLRINFTNHFNKWQNPLKRISRVVTDIDVGCWCGNLLWCFKKLGFDRVRIGAARISSGVIERSFLWHMRIIGILIRIQWKYRSIMDIVSRILIIFACSLNNSKYFPFFLFDTMPNFHSYWARRLWCLNSTTIPMKEEEERLNPSSESSLHIYLSFPPPLTKRSSWLTDIWSLSWGTSSGEDAFDPTSANKSSIPFYIHFGVC